MQPLGWHDLATAIRGKMSPPQTWGRSQRVSNDSREIEPGDTFWAIAGERYDGHDFATEAVRKGASLVVCQADRAAQIPGPKIVVDDTVAALGRLAHWHRRRHEALIIGVTGSVGKTTTKELIHAALSVQFQGLRNPGNFNNLIGLPKSLLELSLEHEYFVCEMGASREGDIRALTEIAAPEVGVITAIAPAHLESFGSLEAIVRGKGELLEALPETGFAVLPGDTPITREMASRAKCRVVLVGEQSHNDVRATHIEISSLETSFTVEGESFTVALPGPGMLSNALCAIAVAREIGVPLDAIATGLEAFRPLPGRGTIHEAHGISLIDDSYNASPKSVSAACQRLAMFATPTRSRRYAVLGDMCELGTAAVSEHRRIGELLATLPLDGVLAYGPHARDIADGALRGGWRPGKIVATESLEVLQLVLDCWLEPGDAVLVKGSRAMAMERVLDWLKQRAQSSAQAPRLRSA